MDANGDAMGILVQAEGEGLDKVGTITDVLQAAATYAVEGEHMRLEGFKALAEQAWARAESKRDIRRAKLARSRMGRE